MKILRCVLAVILCAMIPVSCLAVGESGMAYTDYDSMYTLAENAGFKLGACYSFSDLRRTAYLDLMKYHFNSITPTNELKAYSLLDGSRSKLNPEGAAALNWYQADKMLAWAQENGVKVRGHVLVWDAYMTDWFFREGYDSTNPYASQEVCRERVRLYIEAVMTHCEENFPGVVYCWDVVNEAVGDSAGEYDAADPRHLRTMRSGSTNIFRDLVGDDYVAYAFQCARNTAEALGADIRLFYNDYNTFQPAKRTAIVALINSVNSYETDAEGNPRKLCDGVGMQCYIGGYGTQNGCMSDSDITLIREAIELYGSMGLEVHVTEMAIRNYSADEDQVAKHAEYCGKLFEMFASINTEESAPLTCVAMWGAVDCDSLPSTHYSWKLNSPYCGLFTEKLQLKNSFTAVYDALSK